MVRTRFVCARTALLQGIDQIDNEKARDDEERYDQEQIKDDRRPIGVLIDLPLDLFVPDEGQYAHNSAKPHQENPQNRGKAMLSAGLLQLPGAAQSFPDQRRELPYKQTKPFHDETEGHDGDTRPYPREKGPFVRHVYAAITGPRGQPVIGKGHYRAAT